jgi:guanylate kinase
MTAALIVLLGVSGSGKTTLLRIIENRAGVVSHKKFTTREKRNADDEKDFLFSPYREWPIDDLLVFNSYGNIFGIQIKKIKEDLNRGTNVIMIVGDKNTVEQIRNTVESRVVVVLVYCNESELYRRLNFSDGGVRRERIPAVKEELSAIYSMLSCVDLVVDNSENVAASVRKILAAVTPNHEMFTLGN